MKKNDYIQVDREVVKKMSEDIQAYLVENNLERVKTKDMMPFLIEKGYFPHDRKKGYPLRQILTDLKKFNLVVQILVSLYSHVLV